MEAGFLNHDRVVCVFEVAPRNPILVALSPDSQSPRAPSEVQVPTAPFLHEVVGLNSSHFRLRLQRDARSAAELFYRYHAFALLTFRYIIRPFFFEPRESHLGHAYSKNTNKRDAMKRALSSSGRS
jgi:hypothetical protein